MKNVKDNPGQKNTPGKKRYRPDKDGTHRAAFDRARKQILRTQTVCAICGQPVDKRLKFPDPMSPCIDHIIPIDKGGHPSDIANLQLAHLSCNRQKSDKIFHPETVPVKTKEEVSNRVLPQTINWQQYRSR